MLGMRPELHWLLGMLGVAWQLGLAVQSFAVRCHVPIA